MREPDGDASDYEFSELIAVGDIASALPPLPSGEKYAASTLYHWLNLSGQDRRTLRSVQIGKHRFVTARWLREFFEQSESTNPTKARTPAARERARESAKKRLAEVGI